MSTQRWEINFGFKEAHVEFWLVQEFLFLLLMTFLCPLKKHSIGCWKRLSFEGQKLNGVDGNWGEKMHEHTYFLLLGTPFSHFHQFYGFSLSHSLLRLTTGYCSINYITIPIQLVYNSWSIPWYGNTIHYEYWLSTHSCLSPLDNVIFNLS